MAEPLKNQFGAEVPRAIAIMIKAVHPPFDSVAFIADALDGYDDLELMPRGKKIAQALQRHLPSNYPQAASILLASLSQPHARDMNQSLASFLYLPHTVFVGQYGLDHFEVSMRLQHALTQLFTAEFSIRPFLEAHPKATLKQLRLWAADDSAAVRRLVSEGTRPRLPWAPRLREFQINPKPVLELLDLLKDDPDLYVRRSVANSLNDIGKDHPELLIQTARSWSQNASVDRQWIIRHALRSAVKRGDHDALALMGFGDLAQVAVSCAMVTPEQVNIGDAVVITFELSSTGNTQQRVLVDYRVHYVKANGQVKPKVFKLTALTLAPSQTVAVRKSLSLAERTTRKHYPGLHAVDVLINGHAHPLGAFKLLPA